MKVKIINKFCRQIKRTHLEIFTITSRVIVNFAKFRDLQKQVTALLAKLAFIKKTTTATYLTSVLEFEIIGDLLYCFLLRL